MICLYFKFNLEFSLDEYGGTWRVENANYTFLVELRRISDVELQVKQLYDGKTSTFAIYGAAINKYRDLNKIGVYNGDGVIRFRDGSRWVKQGNILFRNLFSS